MESKKNVNWGVLGTARVGLNYVIPAIQQSLNGKVVAIASRDEKKAQQTAKSFGIPNYYGDYGKLLESEDVEAVYIPLPNSLHHKWTIVAAENGKHVLCEKPLAVNVRECQEMISACKNHAVWLLEGYMYRFHPQIRRLQEILNSGSIGRILIVRTEYAFVGGSLEDIRYQKGLGGGSLLDLGCYCIDVTRLLMDSEPNYLVGAANFHPEKDVDETFVGLMRFPTSKVGLFGCAFHPILRHRLEVIGDEGLVELPAAFEPGCRAEIFVRRISRTEHVEFESTNPYRLMVEHFADCVIEDHAPLMDPTGTVGNLRAMELLQQSARAQSG